MVDINSGSVRFIMVVGVMSSLEGGLVEEMMEVFSGVCDVLVVNCVRRGIWVDNWLFGLFCVSVDGNMVV